MTLQEYRKSSDTTQMEFAVKIGVTISTVQRIERGEACSLRTARKIVEATAGQVRYEDLPVGDEKDDEEPASGPTSA